MSNVNNKLNEIKKEISNTNSSIASNDSVRNKNIEASTLSTIDKLISNFSDEVQNGKITIRDIKEFKDIVGVYTQISQLSMENENTPQVDRSIINNFYSSEFNEPNTDRAIANGINNKLIDLDEDEGTDFIAKREKAINNENANNM